MDAVLNIKERILEDAREEADRIIANARDRATKIIEEKKIEAESIKAQSLAKDLEIGKEQSRRMLSSAHMDIKKRELEVKLALIDEAFEHVLLKIRQMSESEYDDLILNMLDGLSFEGDEQIIFPQRPGRVPSLSIIDRLNSNLRERGLGGNIKISDLEGDFEFGFVVESEGVEMNNSLEAILSSAREGIEPEVAAILFQEKSED